MACFSTAGLKNTNSTHRVHPKASQAQKRPQKHLMPREKENKLQVFEGGKEMQINAG